MLIVVPTYSLSLLADSILFFHQGTTPDDTKVSTSTISSVFSRSLFRSFDSFFLDFRQLSSIFFFLSGALKRYGRAWQMELADDLLACLLCHVEWHRNDDDAWLWSLRWGGEGMEFMLHFFFLSCVAWYGRTA